MKGNPDAGFNAPGPGGLGPRFNGSARKPPRRGVLVLETPGHTQGHISLELAGGDGLVIGGDAITHAVISFQHPSWKVPVDHDPDVGVSSRVRLFDRLATDKLRLVGAHLPFPGTASSSARRVPIASCRLEFA